MKRLGFHLKTTTGLATLNLTSLSFSPLTYFLLSASYLRSLQHSRKWEDFMLPSFEEFMVSLWWAYKSATEYPSNQISTG